MSNEIPVVRNFFIAFMLVTVIVGYDIAHSETPNAMAQEIVSEASPSPISEVSNIKVGEVRIVTSTPKPKEYTCESAIDEVFGDGAPKAKKVSFCESSFNPQARHTNSSAKGCFQIINGTWKLFKCTGDPLNAMDNVKCAKKIYDHTGAWNTSGGWKASYHCHKEI